MEMRELEKGVQIVKTKSYQKLTLCQKKFDADNADIV